MQVGDVVAGVRLTGFVGEGASGRVWAGTDETDGTRVAVKLLHDGAGDAEGALLGGLRHHHVLAVRRVVHDPPAVITELAGGGSLAAQVRARGAFGAPEVVTVLAPLADALAWVHGRGVVHGDVSAANVLFVERGRPVLSDLGGARLASSGTVVATPGYAAPEVVAGSPPTPASDVHGLAAVAWEALTGTAPPVAEDRLPLRLLAPECPDVLVDAVTAALDPDPQARPGPLELAAAARAACPGEPVRLVPGVMPGVRAEEAITYRVREAAARDRAAARGRASRRGGRSRLRTLLVVGVTALSLLLVAGLGLVLGPDLLGPRDTSREQVARSGTAGTAGTASADPAADSTIDPDPAPADLAPPASQELRGEVVRLVAARESALRSGDLRALDGVHHPDGPALADDSALLLSGPVDVRYEVLEVRVTTEPHRAVVDLRTVLAGGTTLTERVVLDLQRSEGTWLVRAVGATA